MVLREAAALVAGAVAFGAFGAVVLGRVISRLLFGVGAADPRSFATAAAGIFIVAFLATYAPARRAARMDPIAALRDE